MEFTVTQSYEYFKVSYDNLKSFVACNTREEARATALRIEREYGKVSTIYREIVIIVIDE